MNRPGAQRVIKKYSNRRLYDTAESRYITLDELAESIRRGAEARVLDAQTGEDLTQATLAQIIIEGRGAAQFLSVPILTQLIRMNDDALSEFFGRWLSAALELYQQARQGVQAIAPYNPLAAMPFAAGNVLSRMLSVMPGPWMPAHQAYAPPAFAPPPQGPPEPPVEVVHHAPAEHHAPVVHADAASVEALRRELDELKLAVRGSAASAPAERSTRRRETASRKPSAKKKG
jgi:polyhydroxyalkanoate synthesis repressor PhaR